MDKKEVVSALKYMLSEINNIDPKTIDILIIPSELAPHVNSDSECKKLWNRLVLKCKGRIVGGLSKGQISLDEATSLLDDGVTPKAKLKRNLSKFQRLAYRK